MSEFSKQEELMLQKLHPDLQKILIHLKQTNFPFKIIETHRSIERQKELLSQGKTKTLNSKHCRMPSEAFDICPLPVNWKDSNRFYYLAGWIMGIAKELDIKIIWGGDWDSDTEIKDNRFNDLVHFEI